jgi:hypothetical protein
MVISMAHSTQEQRMRVGTPVAPWRVFLAILAVPAAWTLQVCIAEALVAQSCFPYDAPMRASFASAALRAVVGISAAALLVGVIGTFFSWRNWRRLVDRARNVPPRDDETLLNGEAFIAKVGFMSSLLFLFALVATDVAVALVSAC